MCINEQVTVIEELTEIISSEMGIREQLEAIQIINPKAAVSSHDTEFIIGQYSILNFWKKVFVLYIPS